MKFTHILLYVSNLEKTAEFYQKLGFEISKDADFGIWAKLGEFELYCGDQAKMLFQQDVNRFKGAGVFMYIFTDDVDVKYNELKQKGLKPSSEPRDFDWGKREFAIKDPDGYKIIFYKKLS